jgi:WD40 repeat protein
MTAAATSFYVTGGTLRPDAPSYVERAADRDLYEGLSQGQFCYVLHARQMGKSSLMARTAARLREEGVAVVVLDLTAIGQNVSVEQWYDGLLVQLGAALDLEDELDDYWREHPRVGPLQRWMSGLRDVVLARVPGRVVLFIDEIDVVQSLPFSTDEFLAGIRECYNRRVEDPAFERLTFCLLGVASPSDLIRDARLTPFNIGRRIELTDFTEAEAAPLAAGLPGKREAEAVLQRILHWTNGHPYLTQRLCQAVAAGGKVASGPEVDRLCEELFLSPRARERDDNLLFVRERMLHSGVDRAGLLELYRHVRQGKRVADDEGNPLVSLLRLSGVVRSADGRLQVRNRIYERVFDAAWVTSSMPDAELRRQRAAYRRGVVRTAAIAAVVLAVVVGLGLQAGYSGRLAREGQRTLRHHLYATQVHLAQQAWEAGNIHRARELLEAQKPGKGEEDLRGFEWRYLWPLCEDQSLARLTGHTNWVFTVAFSPDGKLLATGSRDRTVKLWDPTTRLGVATLATDHRDAIISLAFSPDARTLATGSADHTVRLWDIASRRRIAALDGYEGWPEVAFSPDGKLFAAGGGADGFPSRAPLVTLWDVRAKRIVARLRSADPWIAGVAFSPDGKTLATGSRGRTVTFWSITTGQPVARFDRRDGARVVALSPDGKLLASTGQGSGGITLWEIATGKASLLASQSASVQTLAFSPDSKTLASGDSDFTARLWDVRTRQQRAVLLGHSEAVMGVAFSPDGRLLATASLDHTVRLWDTRMRPRQSVFRGPSSGEVTDVAFSRDGKTLACSGDQGVRLWDIGLGQEVVRLPRSPARMDCVAFSPDDTMLAAGGKGNTVRLWDVRSRREVRALTGAALDAQDLEFSPDGQRLAGAIGNEARLWDVASGQQVASFGWRKRVLVEAVAWSPDGTLLAVGGEGTLKLWSLASGRELTPLVDQPWPSPHGIHDLEFAPGGRLLAAGALSTEGKAMVLWDVATKSEAAILRGYKGTVYALAFSPDGKTLAAAGHRWIQLWDLATREETVRLRSPKNGVKFRAMAFSPDGDSLAVASWDGSVWLWRAAPFAETDARDGARPKAASR